jgi:uncharacterized OB-fold protein
MTPEEKERWYKRQSERIGVPEDRLRRFFDEELDDTGPVDVPLEVPDEITIKYKYSLGGQSRFFREMRRNKKLFGARCPQCGITFCPPRQDCNRCYGKTEWVELSGEGTVLTCCSVHFTNSSFIKKIPFICALVRLDGTDFLVLGNIEMDDVSRAKPGMRVKAVFREDRDGAITDFYFDVIDREE